MGKALERQCGEVIRIGPLLQQRDDVLRAKQVFYTYVVENIINADRASKVLKSYADQVSACLKDESVDVVFSPGTMPICYLQSSAPIVFWTDATVAGMIDFYPGWSDLCNETLRDAHRMEQAALSNCRLAIYSSNWAAETAINNYQVDAAKVKVVPFGANVESVRDLNDIRKIVEQRSTDICKLLFIGSEWYRKGGDIAVDIAESLNAKGLKTELTVLGSVIKGSVPDFVSPKGFVSKKDQQRPNSHRSSFCRIAFPAATIKGRLRSCGHCRSQFIWSASCRQRCGRHLNSSEKRHQWICLGKCRAIRDPRV